MEQAKENGDKEVEKGKRKWTKGRKRKADLMKLSHMWYQPEVSYPLQEVRTHPSTATESLRQKPGQKMGCGVWSCSPSCFCYKIFKGPTYSQFPCPLACKPGQFRSHGIRLTQASKILCESENVFVLGIEWEGSLFLSGPPHAADHMMLCLFQCPTAYRSNHSCMVEGPLF